MFIEQTEQQQKLRLELREYFASLMTPARVEATREIEGGPEYKAIIRELGEDGWLTLGWPEEYGGQDRGPFDQLIFFEEALLANVPIPFVTINTVAPALMAHGSEQQKSELLPQIAAGKLHFSIGYTEPDSGSDLASLKTSAVKDGSEYVINGTKVFTSGAESADYIWLAARTDKDAPTPHHGITIFMVDTQQPGFRYSSIRTVGSVRTNITYYDDVRCPESMICGTLNGGWKLITSQLNHERVGLAAMGVHGASLYQRTLNWALTPDPSGRPYDNPTVRSLLAEAFARTEAMKIMNWRMTSSLQTGEPDPAFASAMKVYSTECQIEVTRLLMEALGTAALLRRGSVAAQINGDLEEYYRRCQINTFGGGVSELMRDLVASFGLNLPYRRG